MSSPWALRALPAPNNVRRESMSPSKCGLESDDLHQGADVLTKSRTTGFAQALAQKRRGLFELSGRRQARARD